MPVHIRAKTHNFSDPTGLLSDCHRRIEMFLGTLVRVADVIDHPPTADTTHALETALRYFGQSAPKHNADEEESLFPRLRQKQHAEIQSAIIKLEELEEEHRWASPLHARIERLGAQYLSTGSLSAPEVDEFRKTIGNLESMYKRHIGIEDELIFPLATQFLSEADRAAIAGEMASRRDVQVVTEIADLHA